MVRVAIIGASGYTGAESIEIILRHSEAELTYLTALPEECGAVSEVFGQFKGRCDLQIEPLDLDKLSKLADVALCCLPHKVSMGFVPPGRRTAYRCPQPSSLSSRKYACGFERWQREHIYPAKSAQDLPSQARTR